MGNTNRNNKRGKVRVILKNGFVYVGEIIEEGEHSIRIIDKYGKRVFILMDSVSAIQEADE